jgi:hypothetical protein
MPRAGRTCPPRAPRCHTTRWRQVFRDIKRPVRYPHGPRPISVTVSASCAVVVACPHAAGLESASRSHRGRGLCGPASPPATCRRPQSVALFRHSIPKGIPGGVSRRAQKQLCVSSSSNCSSIAPSSVGCRCVPRVMSPGSARMVKEGEATWTIAHGWHAIDHLQKQKSRCFAPLSMTVRSVLYARATVRHSERAQATEESAFRHLGKSSNVCRIRFGRMAL